MRFLSRVLSHALSHAAFAPRPVPGIDRVPDGLPTPRPYGHLDPGDGACLMETASVLAAEPFTDSPRGTDPALAALGRMVNDAVGDETRRRLLPLAADLAGVRPAERSFTPSLIADALCAARTTRPSSRLLALRETRCRRRAQRLNGAATGLFSGARDVVWWRGPGHHHLEQAVRVLARAPDAEDRLARLLREAVANATATNRTASARTASASASATVE